MIRREAGPAPHRSKSYGGQAPRSPKGEGGFTLIEMLIAVAIFTFVLAAASAFFIMSVRQYKTQTKIVEAGMEGTVGIELMRRDLDGIGYGLPWNNLPTSSTYYSETTAAALNSLNDFPYPPRAVAGIDCAAFTVNQSDYLVVKSASVGMGDSAGKWTTLTQSGSKRTWTPAAENISNADYVIVLAIGSTATDRRSLVNPLSPYTQYGNTGGFVPVEPYSANIVYGIGAAAPKRPFNRAEYYIANAASTPSVIVPRWCASNTGVLVKAVVPHNDTGTISDADIFPLLDCAADMQVVYGLDNNADGAWDSWAASLPGAGATAAANLRSTLVEIRVSILAHEGIQDNTYTHPASTIYVGFPDVGGGRDFDVSAFRNFRWKLYNFVIKPRSLAQ